MNLADLPWTKVRDALARGEKVIAILSCGATEAHGPHLPLNTDVVISDGMAQRASEMLGENGLTAFVLPPLAYAPAEYAAAFPGTITISAQAAKAVVTEIARSLQSQGFACLAIANSHFDPANVAMLRQATEEIRALGLPVAFPDFTRRALAQTLTAEFISGACHAGQFETSLVMADRPDLVDKALCTELAANSASLVTAIAAGAKTFAEAGGREAYFGDPSQASAAEGEATYTVMAQALVASIREALQNE